MPLGDGALGRALDACKHLFDECVAPPADRARAGTSARAVDWGGAALQLSATMPTSRGVDAACSATSTAPDRAAELARLLLGGELLHRRDLLSECLEWSGEVPFQRLEYLGDAG